MPVAFSSEFAQINLPAILAANGMGSYLMSVILMSRRKRARLAFPDGRIFYWMCRLCLGLCVLETVGFFLEGKLFPGARTLFLWISAAGFWASAILSYLWICYVDYKLFGDLSGLRRRSPAAAAPAAVIALLSVVNLFVDVFFGITEDNLYYRTALVILPYAVAYGYLTWGLVMTCRGRRAGRRLYMPALVFLIPVYLGSLIQLLHYGIALIWASVAIGLTFLYINLQHEENFLDPLTGLYNRNYLTHYIADRGRAGGRVTGILLDINDFKYINDTFGHVEGDRVLQAVGQMLVRAAGSDAVVIRYGGDEFVVLLEGVGQDRTEQVKKALDEELQAYRHAGGTPLSLAAGVAELDGRHVMAFFREMDRNMYQKKRAFYQRREAGAVRVDGRE